MPYFGRRPLLVSERGHSFPGRRLRKFLIALITTVLLAVQLLRMFLQGVLGVNLP
jgi:hypothetical protein